MTLHECPQSNIPSHNVFTRDDWLTAAVGRAAYKQFYVTSEASMRAAESWTPQWVYSGPIYLDTSVLFTSCYCSHRSDDVFIATYSKSGTTFLQMLVEMLRSGGDTNFEEITEVQPWLDFCLDIGFDQDDPQARTSPDPTLIPIVSHPLHQRYPGITHRRMRYQLLVQSSSPHVQHASSELCTCCATVAQSQRGLRPRCFKSHQLPAALNRPARLASILRDPEVSSLWDASTK